MGGSGFLVPPIFLFYKFQVALNKMKSYGIIGLGKVGTTLAKALKEKNQLLWIFSESSNNISKFPKMIHYDSYNQIKQLPDVIFITKSDRKILEAAQNLTETFSDKLKDKIVIHCSGINDKSLLACCAHFGAITAFAHPYQTFFYPDTDLLNGIAWAVDGGLHTKRIEQIVQSLNGIPVDVSKIDFNNSLYHASAVIASNSMHTTISLAAEIAKLSGIDPLRFLPQILKQTMDNILSSFKEDSAIPLTGPVVRGDTETIILHMIALKHHPDLLSNYKQLCLITLENARRKNSISSENYEVVKNILQNTTN